MIPAVVFRSQTLSRTILKLYCIVIVISLPFDNWLFVILISVGCDICATSCKIEDAASS